MMRDAMPYERIPDYPEAVGATTVLARLIDGLGFRFRWATEGLGEAQVDFRPSPGSNSIRDMARHIWGLLNWITLALSLKPSERPEDFEELRLAVLGMLIDLRRSMVSMNEETLTRCTIEGLPFWHLINGPLADALTHVGQINAFRRLAGNPTPKANVFTGLPPAVDSGR